MDENKKCCWSECERKSVCGISTNNSKGSLDMCEECYQKYINHCNAREKLFREEGQLSKDAHEPDCELEEGKKIVKEFQEKTETTSNKIKKELDKDYGNDTNK